MASRPSLTSTEMRQIGETFFMKLTDRWLSEPSEVSTLGKRIRDKIPWHIVNLQINRSPKVYRLVQEPDTHKASTRLHDDDDQVTVVTEDLGDVMHARRRFAKPVRIGIFGPLTPPTW
eukprot:5744595-Amphidinium_carterae.2